MEIFALYGPSGTGKSTSALALAHKYQISAIIDDGLFIYQGRKIAGYSAKYENTTVQAVKRAIFFYPEHAEEVKQSMCSHPFDRLLILGTSRKMIHRIKEALDLPEIDHFIHISDIRTSAEMKAALFDREMQGRHVIPIPRLQVEQDFIHRLIAQVQKAFSAKQEEIGETTIVHPPFHAGRIHVAEQVLKKIIIHSCRTLPFVKEFRRIKVDLESGSLIEVDLKMELQNGDNIKHLGYQVQKSIHQSLIDHLNLEMEKIQVVVSQINLLHQ